jgi:transcription elongation factor GreA
MADSGPGTILRDLGLLPDGPVLWGRPVPSRAPGIYVVELPAPVSAAPIDLGPVGAWIERAEALRLDGSRPTGKPLATRLASFWIPSTAILYAGATTVSLGGRVAALVHHVPGDRRPHPEGQWLHLLRGLDRCRVWWAETDAAEEYLDAFLDAFAGTVPANERAALPDPAVVLPWAVTRSPAGARKSHGITGAVVADDSPPAPAPRVTTLPDGAADGVEPTPSRVGRTRPPQPAGKRPTSRGGAPGPSAVVAERRRRHAKEPEPAPAGRNEPVHLTPEAVDRLTRELDELTRRRRPEVVARIKAARELGDLRENAEYHAAREEQSFLEGRIRLLEDRLRNASLIEGGGTPHVDLGSTVTVEVEGERAVYSIVGSAEADPANGRLSSVSPVGSALLGHAVGDDVAVRTPRGSVVYRIVALD